MTIGTERTTTTASQTRETPNLFRAPEKDVDRDLTHDPVSSQIHALMSADGATGSSLRAATIFRSPEFSQPVNDSQKARVLRSLQRSHGNQSVQRMMNRSVPAGIQPKLEISSPGDALEREADSIANQVMNMSSPNSAAPAQLSRHPLPISRAPEGVASRTASPEFERNLNAQGGSGQPLSRSSREFFEPRMGHDLSGVRVHHGGEAAAAAQEINAQAFTHGRDIYFNEGKYQPETTSGRRLLAHELAHTVQQAGGTQRSVIRRTEVVQRNGPTPNPTPGAPRTPPGSPDLPLYLINGRLARGTDPPPTGNVRRELHLPTLEVPGFKREKIAASSHRLYRKADYRRGSPNQRDKWERQFRSATSGALQAKGMSPSGLYLVRATTGSASQREGFQILGDLGVISAALAVPFWDDTGNFNSYQVDHIVELQMSGWPEQRWANEVEQNMELLDARANETSGDVIRSSIVQAITHAKRYFDQHPDEAEKDPATNRPRTHSLSEDEIKVQYDLSFGRILAGGGGSAKTWSRESVANAAHINTLVQSRHIKALDLREARDGVVGNNEQHRPPNGILVRPTAPVVREMLGAEGLSAILGAPELRLVFLRGTGGRPRRFAWTQADSSGRRPTGAERDLIPSLLITDVQFPWTPAAGRIGMVSGIPFVRLFQRNILTGRQEASGPRIIGSTGTQCEPLNLDVLRVADDCPYAGRLDQSQLAVRLRELGQVRRQIQLGGMSPIEFDTVDMNENGLLVTGRVIPNIPMLRGTTLDLIIEGDDLRVEKTFSTSDLQLPSPLRLTSCSLRVAVSTNRGIQVAGRADLEIGSLATGYIQAEAGTSGGFALEGGLTFDRSAFRGQVDLVYRNHEFSGSGSIELLPGKIRGVRTARIEASYAHGVFTANGTAQFSIPGLNQATLGITQSATEGTVLTAGLELGSVPGIRSGSISARLARPSGTTEWQLSGNGTAVPAIPGIDSSLRVSIDRGIFTAEARASYNRGMLSGTIEVGATNRPINPEGRPVEGGEPARTITPYGQGQLTVRIAPWLQGTIGVRILPNGEIEVSGAIGLPASLNIFPAKPFNKNIFHIDLDIPIVGVTVLRQRIGIFATIGGGLDVDAGIGPGQLRELGLGITYNPAHEDQTHVTGRAQLFIPAHAGLRLFVRGGLGVGIPIVSATARLVVGASLGLEGAVVASVEVDWMPQRGLILNARGEIYAQPKFRFDVTGEVLVEADLLLTTVELYKKTWNLASFEWGSDLRFGIRFPIHYEEGREFDISLNDVEFVVPQINPLDLLTGLVRRIG